MRDSMAASVRSIEIGTTSTSPQSATRSRSNGWTFSTGCHGRMSDDCSRTARGPNRAPVRYETPPSYGIPTSATSSPAAVAAAGRSMNVAPRPNRGGTKASRGSGGLTPIHPPPQRRPPFRGRRRSVHLHPWNGRQSLERLSGERPPVLRDALHPELLEVLDRGGEPDRFGDRGGSGLESPRQVVPLSPVDPDLLDHLAPPASRLQRL